MNSFLNPVRGWHVLVIISAFFGVMITVNIIFMTMAFSTHPGEDVARSYMQGINFNDTLDRRRAQAELGWTARVNVDQGRVLIEVIDPAGSPVEGLSLAGILAHPTDTGQDCPLAFIATGAGRYAARLDCGIETGWQMRVRHEGEPPFELEQALWLN
jgi:nitrogen fixation protein FixH